MKSLFLLVFGLMLTVSSLALAQEACPLQCSKTIDGQAYPMNLYHQGLACTEGGEMAKYMPIVSYTDTQITISILDAEFGKTVADSTQTDAGQKVKFTFSTPAWEIDCQRIQPAN